MTTANIIKGLYSVTPDWADTTKLLQAANQALAGGASVLQYRHKLADPALRRTQAEALLALCQQYGALLLINDNIELAAAINAHGVHIGADDTPLQTARDKLGRSKIIGVSCYNQLRLAQEAEANGADYVAFGSFFASPTKPQAVTAPLSLLREARQSVQIPVVAIGGITLENAASLVDAGADAVAVISALFDSPKIKTTAASFRRLFEPSLQSIEMA